MRPIMVRDRKDGKVHELERSVCDSGACGFFTRTRDRRGRPFFIPEERAEIVSGAAPGDPFEYKRGMEYSRGGILKTRK